MFMVTKHMVATLKSENVLMRFTISGDSRPTNAIKIAQTFNTVPRCTHNIRDVEPFQICKCCVAATF